MASVRQHVDARSPLVRAMAAWALRQLLPEAEVASVREACLARETDAEVAAEWRHPA